MGAEELVEMATRALTALVDEGEAAADAVLREYDADDVSILVQHLEDLATLGHQVARAAWIS